MATASSSLWAQHRNGRGTYWPRSVAACRSAARSTSSTDRGLAAPPETGHLPRITARLLDGLGFRYLLLHRLEQHPGELEAREAPLEAVAA
jgi:hypothetical protein